MRPSTRKPAAAPTSTTRPSGKTISTRTVVAKPSLAAKPLAPRPITPAAPLANKAAATPAPSLPAKPQLVKPAKIKKPKLVRDSFTIPKAEYSVLGDLKQRAVKLSKPAKKSELLLAGVKALAAMSDGAFVAA